MNTLPVMQSITMTSREIAELTGKEHKNVLRDIDNMLESTGSNLSRSVKSTSYIDVKGEARRQPGRVRIAHPTLRFLIA